MATTSTVFSSTVDEELLRQITQAEELAGTRKPVKAISPTKTFACPEGYQPIMSVLPLKSCPQNISVRVFKVEDWPEHLRPFIPKVDKLYVFNPEATLVVAQAIAGYNPNPDLGAERVLLHGKKGSGKTTLPQQICARINMPFIRVNARRDMDSSALFGSVTYDPVKGVDYVEGPAAELGRAGGCLCIDEVSNLTAGIAASVMPMLERNGTIYLADKPGKSEDKFIIPNDWFRIVCTDNTELQGDTTGKYAGTNVQNEALIDRFTTTIRLDYLEPAHEVAIITGKVTSVDKMLAAQMVQLAGLIRNAYDEGNAGFTMSPRGLVEWATKIDFWGDVGRAFKLSFFNKLTLSDQAVVAEFYHTVFGENLRK
jgi:cobaltochelatase CobS